MWVVCTACDGLGWRFLVAKDDSPLLMRVLKWILHTTLAVSFPVLLTTALDCCPVNTSCSTQLVPHRTGSEPTAMISVPKAWDQWPRNLPNLNPLDYHVWGRYLEAYHKRHPKPKTIAEPKEVLQVTWDSLPQGPSRQSCQSNWRPVLQLRVDILNIHSNCNVITLLLLLEQCYFTLWLLGHFWTCKSH